jgi:hypothetical protein
LLRATQMARAHRPKESPSPIQWGPRNHIERNHQGLGNDLIVAGPKALEGAQVRCGERLGGLLRYYQRAA